MPDRIEFQTDAAEPISEHVLTGQLRGRPAEGTGSGHGSVALRCVWGDPRWRALSGLPEEPLHVETMLAQPSLGGRQLILAEQSPVPWQQHEGLDAHLQPTMLPNGGKAIRRVTAAQQVTGRFYSTQLADHLHEPRRVVPDLP